MHPDQCQSPTFCMPFPILKLSALLSECMNSISINQCAARSPRGKQEGIFSPFSFTERTRERLRLVWRDTCFSSFLPTRVNFVLKKRSGLLWNAMGKPRQIFFRPVPLAWRRPICSSASRGALPTSMPVLKLQRCPAHRGLDSIPRWWQYHRAASAAVREQYFVDNHGLCELFILARKLCWKQGRSILLRVLTRRCLSWPAFMSGMTDVLRDMLWKQQWIYVWLIRTANKQAHF